MNSLSIGQLSVKSGLSVASLRYYEQIGLIQSRTRLAGKPRHFYSDAVKRLEAIGQLQELGFTLKEIRDLAGSLGSPAVRCRKLLKKLREKLEETEKSLALQRLRRERISRTLKTCQRLGSGISRLAIGQLLGLNPRN
jgi:MerR family copper efflux transcriptional regulator